MEFKSEIFYSFLDGLTQHFRFPSLHPSEESLDNQDEGLYYLEHLVCRQYFCSTNCLWAVWGNWLVWGYNVCFWIRLHSRQSLLFSMSSWSSPRPLYFNYVNRVGRNRKLPRYVYIEGVVKYQISNFYEQLRLTQSLLLYSPPLVRLIHQ